MAKIGDEHSFYNPEFVMMDRLSELVADYEDQHYAVEIPSLIDVIKLRLYEMRLKQKMTLQNSLVSPKVE